MAIRDSAPPPDLSLRLPRSYFWIGWAGVLFPLLFALGVVGSILLGNATVADLALTLPVAIFFISIGSYLVLMSKHYRLCVSEEAVLERGLIRTKSIQFKDAHRMRWLIGGGGGAVIHGREAKISFRRDQCRDDDWPALVERLHHAFDPELQEQWREFELRYVNPDDAEIQRRTTSRKRIYAFCVVFFGLFALAALYAGLIGAGAPGQFYVYAAVNGVGALLCAWRLWMLSQSKHKERR